MIVNKKIEEYIKQNTSDEDDILHELNRETHIKILNPRMLSGHPQGKLLELISKIKNPGNILEIGTFTGYSTICLAKGLKEGGTLHTIEKNDELTEIQNKYFKKAGINDKIKVYIGDALNIIPKLNINFDLVFIDADKKDYLKFYELSLTRLTKGGIIITDNVLWNGKVLDDKKMTDNDTEAIKMFNKTVKNDMRSECVILPVRDGISLIRKI